MTSPVKVLYITSSSFSGSTLLAFLLNTHPEIFTVSEMEGWNYTPGEEFHCSCGQSLETCPFFSKVEKAFQSNMLPFQHWNFGTAYRLVNNERINRYITENLPFGPNKYLEHVRDNLISILPPFSSRIHRINKANTIFIHTSLAYSKASTFVDASKNPYRMRFLRKLSGIDLHVLHLVRDLRGVALSNMLNRNVNAQVATELWLKDQTSILDVEEEFPKIFRLYYEDLCEEVDEQLADIHRFIGLEPKPFTGNFRSSEHHILGNTMRLDTETKIQKSEKWKTKLSPRDLETIVTTAKRYADHNPSHPLSGIINNYIGNQ